MNTIIPITEDNLAQAAVAGAKFGMPRSIGWLRRCFFDPTVEDLTTDKIRGHMSVDENGDVKAIQGYYYQPCYFLQKKILGTSGAIMGADAKYGEEVLVIIDRNRETQSKGMLCIANCISGERSATIARKASRMKDAPCRPCEYRICAIDWAGVALAVLWRLHVRMPLFRKAVYVIMRPLFWFRYFLYRTFNCKRPCRVVRHDSFDDPRFDDFWNRFLAANDGIVSSREPRRLRWLFDDSIKAGKVLLATAENAGKIEGYVLLREYRAGGQIPRSYEIIDICAVRNDVRCLKTLAREAVWIAGRNGGIKVYFSGGMPNQEEWIDDIFPYHRMGYKHTMFKTSNADISDVLLQNKGWFFGPFDGERCLGCGGYIDL